MRNWIHSSQALRTVCNILMILSKIPARTTMSLIFFSSELSFLPRILNSGIADAVFPTGFTVWKVGQWIWSDQIYNIIQLKPGVWRRINQDVGQGALMIIHFIVAHRREAQVFHSVFHKFSKLLSFGSPVEVQSLLSYFFCSFTRVLRPFSAQPSGPLHALPPQQGMVRLVTRRWVAVKAAVVPWVFDIFGVFPLFHTNGYLRLRCR